MVEMKNINLYCFRRELLAFAMLSVLFYHLAFLGIPIGRLNIGYMGVDIFLLFSGYGIAKSLNRNSLKSFFNNRFWRVYPLFGITIIFFKLISCLIYHDTNSLIEIVPCLFTLPYYYNPDIQPDWYFPALFLLYLLSPLFYSLIKKHKCLLPCIIYISSIIIDISGLINHWQWECLTGRISVYVFGMYCAICKYENPSKLLVVILFCIGILFFIKGFHYQFSSAVIPTVVIFANYIVNMFKLSGNKFLSIIGNNTLEIYCADIISSVIAPRFYGYSILVNIMIKVFIVFMCSFLLVYLNQKIQKVRSRVTEK